MKLALEVKDLVTAFATEQGIIRAVEGVSFGLPEASTLGLVGESGCGKSVTALSIMRLLPQPAGRIESGQVLLDGKDILSLSPEALYAIRGRRIAMIFQEPMTALNPVHKIGKQLLEVYRQHRHDLAATEMEREAIALLQQVSIPDPAQRMQEYPHQLSGGMRQRVMIAMALAGNPDIMIADEPTTALDVTIQAQILDLIKTMQRRRGMAVIFITHDLGVVAEMCDHIVVMYAGQVAETAAALDLFNGAKHPYTQGLLASTPRLDYPRKSKLPVIEGIVPGLGEFPPGCRFNNRCSHVMAICKEQEPPMIEIAAGHHAACHLYS